MEGCSPLIPGANLADGSRIAAQQACKQRQRLPLTRAKHVCALSQKEEGRLTWGAGSGAGLSPRKLAP